MGTSTIHSQTNRLTPQHTTHNNTEQNKVLQLKIAQQHWKRILHYKDNTKRQEQETFIIEQNLKQNNNWGDYLSKKRNNTIRIYIQNINGLNIEDI